RDALSAPLQGRRSSTSIPRGALKDRDGPVRVRRVRRIGAVRRDDRTGRRRYARRKRGSARARGGTGYGLRRPSVHLRGKVVEEIRLRAEVRNENEPMRGVDGAGVVTRCAPVGATS